MSAFVVRISGWCSDVCSSDLPLMRGFLSQGCLPGSLYDDDAYGVPNGFALPYVAAAATQINLTVVKVGNTFVNLHLIDPTKAPYAGIRQSRNLREVATAYDPTFRARHDVFQFQDRRSGVRGKSVTERVDID